MSNSEEQNAKSQTPGTLTTLSILRRNPRVVLKVERKTPNSIQDEEEFNQCLFHNYKAFKKGKNSDCFFCSALCLTCRASAKNSSNRFCSCSLRFRNMPWMGNWESTPLNRLGVFSALGQTKKQLFLCISLCFQVRWVSCGSSSGCSRPTRRPHHTRPSQQRS